jgi:hypothetical protein
LVLLFAGAAAAGGCSASNDSVWSSSVTTLVLSHTGGFVAPSPPTADCPAEGVEYTLAVANRALNAWRCAPGADAPHALVRETVSRILSAAELDALVPTLEALEVVHVDTCGADKAAVLVTVTTPSGTTEYADSFYSCDHSDPRPRLDSDTLDRASEAFRKLAFP